MKMNLHFYRRIIVILIVILIPIYSCHSFAPPPNQPEIIQIIGVDANGDLDLKDENNRSARTFEVKAGKTIRWLVNTRDISDVDTIYKKPTSTSDNLFQTGPSRIANSRNWTATIDPGARAGKYEDYNIDWTDKNGQKHVFDPRIQIKQ